MAQGAEAWSRRLCAGNWLFVYRSWGRWPKDNVLLVPVQWFAYLLVYAPASRGPHAAGKATCLPDPRPHRNQLACALEPVWEQRQAARLLGQVETSLGLQQFGGARPLFSDDNPGLPHLQVYEYWQLPRSSSAPIWFGVGEDAAAGSKPCAEA